MIVNKHNVIGESITTKLVKDYSFNKNEAREVDERLYNNFKEMADEANKVEVNLVIVKGYTSYETQKAIYDVRLTDEKRVAVLLMNLKLLEK